MNIPIYSKFCSRDISKFELFNNANTTLLLLNMNIINMVIIDIV